MTGDLVGKLHAALEHDGSPRDMLMSDAADVIERYEGALKRILGGFLLQGESRDIAREALGGAPLDA